MNSHIEKKLTIEILTTVSYMKVWEDKCPINLVIAPLILQIWTTTLPNIKSNGVHIWNISTRYMWNIKFRRFENKLAINIGRKQSDIKLSRQ